MDINDIELEMMELELINAQINLSFKADSKCPRPTKDIALNLANRKKAIDKASYGPLNPEQPNDDYWKKLAAEWDVDVAESKKQRCGNCAVFIITPEMKSCIESGLDPENSDEWDAIDSAGQLGYCEAFDFKCASKRTCRAWVTGGPIKTNTKSDELDTSSLPAFDEYYAEIPVITKGSKNVDVKAAKVRLKDPKGGLTAAGRAYFKRTQGANLKPGVRGPANTPEKMRRKGSFLTRFFTNPSGPMKDEKGRPTRLALSAAAWGEPVPQDMESAAKLAAKGRRLLSRYESAKKKGK